MQSNNDDAEASKPLLSSDRPSVEKNYGSSNSIDLQSNFDFPIAKWAWARKDRKDRQFPQTIAHRGYKAAYPENTLKAFKGAVEVGTHAVETDIHLSRDGIVVLSHDPDLKRCFGQQEKIIDCDWDYLSSLRTLREPHEPMPKLSDLLEYMAQPGLEHLWVLLDIKIDNNADNVMRLIADTLDSVDPGKRQWKERVVLGIWVAKFLPLCTKYLPGYPISNIGFSPIYSRQFLKVPNVSFNMLQKALTGRMGASFIRDIRKAERQLFVWTVNEANQMKWSIQKQVDGVITDDPKLFNDICDNWDDNEPEATFTWRQWFQSLWLSMMIMVFSIPFRRRFPETVEQFIQKTDLRAKATLKLGA